MSTEAETASSGVPDPIDPAVVDAFTHAQVRALQLLAAGKEAMRPGTSETELRDWYKDHASAEKSIQRALKKAWDSQLVRQFGLLDTGNAARQLTQAEGWLQEHPEDPQLLLCLGRLCLREKLWGKARDYFESSYRAQVGAEICAELGRLLIGLGEPKVAAAYYREGLALSESQLPELPMPDKVVSNHHLLERD